MTYRQSLSLLDHKMMQQRVKRSAPPHPGSSRLSSGNTASLRLPPRRCMSRLRWQEKQLTSRYETKGPISGISGHGCHRWMFCHSSAEQWWQQIPQISVRAAPAAPVWGLCTEQQYWVFRCLILSPPGNYLLHRIRRAADRESFCRLRSSIFKDKISFYFVNRLSSFWQLYMKMWKKKWLLRSL